VHHVEEQRAGDGVLLGARREHPLRDVASAAARRAPRDLDVERYSESGDAGMRAHCRREYHVNARTIIEAARE